MRMHLKSLKFYNNMYNHNNQHLAPLPWDLNSVPLVISAYDIYQ